MEKLLLEREKEKQIQFELIKKLFKEADQWNDFRQMQMIISKREVERINEEKMEEKRRLKEEARDW